MPDCTCGIGGFDHSADCAVERERPPHVAIVNVDDWSILYIDGKKRLEGHSLRIDDVFRAAGYDLDYRWLDGTDFDAQVSASGITPDDLSEVPDANP